MFLKKLWQKIPFQKKMFPFGNLLPQFFLAPNIIGRQFLKFLISKSLDVQLINKGWIFENTNT
jgi:hypothetical protein